MLCVICIAKIGHACVFVHACVICIAKIGHACVFGKKKVCVYKEVCLCGAYEVVVSVKQFVSTNLTEKKPVWILISVYM